MNIKRITQRAVLWGRKALAIGGVGLSLFGVHKASAQLVQPRTMTLLSAQSLTNGTTLTVNLRTNFLQAFTRTHTARLVAYFQPSSNNLAGAGNYITNAVLKFDWLHTVANGATNATTDVPFTWTIATNQFGNQAISPWTNAVLVSTNLLDTTIDSVQGLQLDSVLTSGTNTYGGLLSLYLEQTP